MQQSFKNVAFKLFDKVIVAVLALLAIAYMGSVFLGKPVEAPVRREADEHVAKIKQKMKEAQPEQKASFEDYVTRTIGAFHPDMTGVQLRPGVFGYAGELPPQKPVNLLCREDNPLPTEIRQYPQFADAQLRVNPPDLVRAEWSEGNRVIFTALVSKAGEATVQFVRAGQVVGEVKVNIQKQVEEPASISPPVPFTVSSALGQKDVRLSWLPARTAKAHVDEYRIYRGDGEKEDSVVLYLKMPITEEIRKRIEPPPPPAPAAPPEKREGGPPAPAEGGVPAPAPVPPAAPGVPPAAAPPAPAEPGAAPAVPAPAPEEAAVEIPTVFAATGQPGPAAVFKNGRFSLADSNIESGVKYWYCAEAAGADMKGNRLVSEKTPASSVAVEESFKIRFSSSMNNRVSFIVSVYYAPPDGGAPEWVDRNFLVERGQQVGWTVPNIVLRSGRRLRSLDFSTGFQLFDLLQNEKTMTAGEPIRNAQGQEVGVRQREETRQKVLLINKRGRIKVLWQVVSGHDESNK